jgi:hypothetical protein
MTSIAIRDRTNAWPDHRNASAGDANTSINGIHGSENRTQDPANASKSAQSVTFCVTS